VSTVPAVKAALRSLFIAALPGVQVIYGPRGNVTITEDSIVEVGGAVGTVAAASLNLREAEEYIVEVTVSVTISSGTQQAATETADALWAAAKAVIRNPPAGSLSVAGVTSVQPVGEFELTETPNPDGPNTAIRFGVHVLAQS
jgi:hypothetical protein